MSDEITDQELDEEMRQLMEKEAAEKVAATAIAEPEPQPAESTPEPQAQPEVQSPESVPQKPAAVETPKADDPMERARRKGLDTPEALARSLASLEDEFHRRNQAGHPGYRDLQNGNPAPTPPPPPPQWAPQPQYPPQGYGYQPPPPSRQDVTQNLAKKYGMDPDDIERLMPMMVDAAEAIAARRTSHLERELSDVRRQSMRSAEFTELMQDPAFADPRVQAEMREVLKDGSLFQRGGRVYTTALQIAVGNLYRKQLQQGSIPESRTPSNTPPVTAGGGNGSANTAPFKVTDAMVASWTDAEQDAFFKSNGKIIPKR